MKTQAARITALAVTLLTVSAALAQTRPGDVIVDVPFSFVIANHQMQSGRYIVTPVTDGILRIYDAQNSKSQMFVSVHSVQSSKPTDPKLVFHRYGSSYFLTQVWNGNSDIGREVPKSKAEKEIASASASNPRPKAEIAVLRPER